MTDPAFEVDLAYRFSKNDQLKVSFSIPLNVPSTTVVFGPSGSGKSTLLDCLAGVKTPDIGTIRFGDCMWFDRSKNVNLKPQERALGLLFQDYPLFPHLSLSHNIAYGLKGISREDRNVQVQHWVHFFGLEGKELRYPDALSGGERQRAALAQILALAPKVLLLDEPFSALDLHTRRDIQGKLRTWVKEHKASALLITHDLAEAVSFGDRLIIMSEGRILQEGIPMDIFSSPALPAVAKIIGIENLLPGKIIASEAGALTIAIGKGHLLATGSTLAGQRCFAALRAEEVVLEKGAASQSSARNRLRGLVLEIVPQGPQAKVMIDCGFLLTACITQQSAQALSLKAGMEIVAVIKASAIHVLPAPDVNSSF